MTVSKSRCVRVVSLWYLAHVFGWIIAVSGAILLVAGSSGCGLGEAIGSGPATIREVSAGTMTITSALASQMSPKNLTASADGSVVNPEYQCTGFVGTGVKWDVTLRLIGADLNFDIAGAGEGKLEPDERILAMIEDVQNRRGINEADRQRIIVELVTQWIASKAAASRGGDDGDDVSGDGVGVVGGGSQTPVGGGSSASPSTELTE